MITVILSGGFGTRLSEETNKIPKPMIKIGNKPIISHIMDCYKSYKYNNFIVLSGYKKEIIKKYYQNKKKVNVVDTGLKTQTGARIKKIMKLIDQDNFFMTYGDGLGNININKLLKFHLKNKKIATMTAVRPIARFGSITLKENKIIKFKEKDKLQEGWINGGFFVLNKRIFNYIDDNEDCIFERKPLEQLSRDGELMAYKHHDFWHPMDTLRDKIYLNNLYKEKKKLWLKR